MSRHQVLPIPADRRPSVQPSQPETQPATAERRREIARRLQRGFYDQGVVRAQIARKLGPLLGL
jgi:hypothetical protein